MTKYFLTQKAFHMFRKTIYFFILVTNSLQSHTTEFTNLPTIRSHATLSPVDDTMIYHGRVEGLKSTLYISNKDGSNERHFWGEANSIEQEPRWSPDGSKIAFVGGSDYQSGALQLHIISSKAQQHKILTSFGAGMVKGPSWSPDSTKILFELRQPNSGISTLHIVDVTSGIIQQLNTSNERMYVQAEWSPDGKAVLVAERDKSQQSKSDLWIFELAHPTHRRRVTNTLQGETMPTWGHDGHYIIYSRPEKNSNQHDLFAFDFRNNNEVQLTASQNISEFFPQVSSDGKFVYYDAFAQAEGIWSSNIKRIPMVAFGDNN